MVNRIYGILANGTPETVYYYRYSTATREDLDSVRQKYLDRLIPVTAKPELRAWAAEYILQLMMSGEDWVKLVNAIDPLNTYDQRTVEPLDVMTPLFTMEELKEWAVRSPIVSTKYPQQRSQSAVDKILNALFAFMDNGHV